MLQVRLCRPNLELTPETEVSRGWRIDPLQVLCVDSVDRLSHHREDVDIIVHSYSDWDSNPPECNSLQLSVTSSLSEANLFSFFLNLLMSWCIGIRTRYLVLLGLHPSCRLG
jgi:hypothetical protein